jgi:hypothetical protein
MQWQTQPTTNFELGTTTNLAADSNGNGIIDAGE